MDSSLYCPPVVTRGHSKGTALEEWLHEGRDSTVFDVLLIYSPKWSGHKPQESLGLMVKINDLK